MQQPQPKNLRVFVGSLPKLVCASRMGNDGASIVVVGCRLPRYGIVWGFRFWIRRGGVLECLHDVLLVGVGI